MNLKHTSARYQPVSVLLVKRCLEQLLQGCANEIVATFLLFMIHHACE